MDPPIVYIEKETFLDMLFASVDTFRKECFGYILGSKPTRNNNCFKIVNVITVASTIKRANKEVRISKGCHERINKIFDKYPKEYPYIGWFHSHPEWGSIPGSHEMSDDDIQETIHSQSDVAVVIKISSRRRERLDWVLKTDGGIRGTFSDYVVDVNMYRIIQVENQNIPESLQIKAEAAIKVLNYANRK